MSFITFCNNMLGEQLAELGFQRKKGTEWFKIIDNCIYEGVYVRKLSIDVVEVYLHIQSLYSHLSNMSNNWDDVGFLGMTDLKFIAAQDGLHRGLPHEKAFHFMFYYDENTDKGRNEIAKCRADFEIVRPIFASVKDLQSCFEAMNLMEYLTMYVIARQLGRRWDLETTTAKDPLNGFFLLCRLGRYDEAAQYLRESFINYDEYLKGVNSDVEELRRFNKNSLLPYLKMAEEHDVAQLQRIIRENYAENCDILQRRLKIKLNREEIVLPTAE